MGRVFFKFYFKTIYQRSVLRIDLGGRSKLEVLPPVGDNNNNTQLYEGVIRIY